MQSTHRKKLNNYVKLIQLADTFQNKKMKLRILNNIEADVRKKTFETSDEIRDKLKFIAEKFSDHDFSN